MISCHRFIIFHTIIQIQENTVDYLFRGTYDPAKSGSGLIYWSGVESASHDGFLKRICPNVLSLIHALVTSTELSTETEGNIFYEHFIRLPETELLKINFSKHIAYSKKILNTAGFSKASLHRERREALELLGILVQNHLNSDGDPEPVNKDQLLKNDAKSKDKLRVWLKKVDAQKVIMSFLNYIQIYIRSFIFINRMFISYLP